MRLIITLALAACAHTAKSATLCDSDSCVCRDDKSDFGILVDCSYYTSIYKDDYQLPDAVSSLDLSWNNLTQIKSTRIFRSNSLTVLLLNNNKISLINSTALRLPKLQRLDLSNNELESIVRDAFKYINELEYLNLGGNRFHTLSAVSLHRLGGLVEIILDDNNIGASLYEKNLFDRSGYGLTNKIRSLSIRGINLKAVRDNFFVDAYDIRRLVIANNSLRDIFELPITLEYLDVSDNPISEISAEDFSDAPALKELMLNNLLIGEVPEFAFADLHGLVNIQLERNKNLSHFDKLAFGQDVLEDSDDFMLERLSLRGSQLTTLSSKLAVPFGQLVQLDLQGNMWNCDCHLDWIKNLQIDDKDSEHLRCYTPRPLFNSKIMELDKKYFVCTLEKHLTGLVIGTISACVSLAFVAAWIYVMVPKSNSNMVKNMYNTAGYSLLPVNGNLSNGI